MLHPIIRSAGVSSSALYLMTLASCLLITTTLGSNYIFASISLKLSAQLNNRDVAILGACNDIGAYTAIIVAVFYDRFGARPTSLLSGAMVSGSYFALWALVPQQLDTWVYCMLFYFVGLGSAGMSTMNGKVAAHSAPPKHRAKVIGLLSAVYGSCGLIFTQVFTQLLNSDVLLHFRLMGVLTAGMSLISFLMVDDIHEDAHSASAYDALPMQAKILDDESMARETPSRVVGGPFSTPSGNVALIDHGGNSDTAITETEEERVRVSVASLSIDGTAIDFSKQKGRLPDDDHSSSSFSSSSSAVTLTDSSSDESLSFLANSLIFWLLCFFLLFAGGCGLGWKNQLSNFTKRMNSAKQLVGDTTLDPNVLSTFNGNVNMVWVVSSMFGRLASTMLCDALSHRVAMTTWLVVAAFLYAVSAGSLVIWTVIDATGVSLLPYFWVANVCNALGWGTSFAVSAAVLATLFGTTSYARNHTLHALSLALASFAVVSVIQLLFDDQLQGINAFANALWFLFGLAIICLPTAGYISWRWFSFPTIPLNKKQSRFSKFVLNQYPVR